MNLTTDELTGLARLFSEKLLAYVGPENMAEVNRRNAEIGFADPVCHSHDFCDANMFMLEAWQEFFGSEPAMLDDAADESGDIEIWNAAWGLAKAARFFEAPDDSAEFFPLADLDAWESFYTANADALAEIGDKATCYALACNCSLMIGGGAAPLFRVGFVD